MKARRRHPTVRLALVAIGLLSLAAGSRGAAPDDLAPWRSGVAIRPVAPRQDRHVVHAYFNTCPESPDGKYVVYFTSSAADGESGDVRVLDRATGEETIVARDVTAEDAHRAACQQWSNDGRTVVYHDCRDGRWFVMAVDVATLESRVLAEDRQVAFGSPTSPWTPIYGCHWNPGEHRDFELAHVVTGEVRTVVEVDDVIREYGDWIEERFGTTDVSIFFPIMSPDDTRAFFKISRPSGGDNFRSKQASLRDGKVVYDLEHGRFVRLMPSWGHPSWAADSTAIFERGNVAIDVTTGRSTRYAPSSITNHPTLSPDGRLFVTDADVTKRNYGDPGDWAVAVGSTTADDFVLLDVFGNTRGAKSWRRSHPHPVFSADGRRVYYNVNKGPWTTLMVAERGVPERPKVVLLGDSIRLSYTATVSLELTGEAVVVSPPANGGDSSNVLKNLPAWAVAERPDVVHFNSGIHDTKRFKATGRFQVSPEQYESNLRAIVGLIRKETDAAVLFATTTPILNDRAARMRSDRDYELLGESVVTYNQIARKVMEELDVPVNDLHGLLTEAGPAELIGDDGVHLLPEGQKLLGKAVAETVRAHLSARAAQE